MKTEEDRREVKRYKGEISWRRMRRRLIGGEPKCGGDGEGEREREGEDNACAWRLIYTQKII